MSDSLLPHGLQYTFNLSQPFPMSQLFTSGGQIIGSFSFSISPSSEYSGLISSRMDWLDLLAVHGTLKSLLQHHSSKALILQRSAFFIVLQLGFLLRIQLFYIYYASQVELVVKQTNKQTNKKTHLPIQEME